MNEANPYKSPEATPKPRMSLVRIAGIVIMLIFAFLAIPNLSDPVQTGERAVYIVIGFILFKLGGPKKQGDPASES